MTITYAKPPHMPPLVFIITEVRPRPESDCTIMTSIESFIYTPARVLVHRNNTPANYSWLAISRGILKLPKIGWLLIAIRSPPANFRSERRSRITCCTIGSSYSVCMVDSRRLETEPVRGFYMPCSRRSGRGRASSFRPGPNSSEPTCQVGGKHVTCTHRRRSGRRRRPLSRVQAVSGGQLRCGGRAWTWTEKATRTGLPRLATRADLRPTRQQLYSSPSARQ